MFSSFAKSESYIEDYNDPYEDAPEFTDPQFELNADSKSSGSVKTEPKPLWTYSFVMLNPNETVQSISKSSSHEMVKPASTMKIFTAWWAFKKDFRKNDYLRLMLTKSVNRMADSTATGLGGVMKMKSFYQEQGLSVSNFSPADGSGLSYENKTNCDTEIALLRLIHNDPEYNVFKKLMAQPKKEGTLKTRLGEFSGKMFAKTGTLNQTAALSGFIDTKKGTVAFCVMGDYLNGSWASFRAKIDSIVRTNFKKI